MTSSKPRGLPTVRSRLVLSLVRVHDVLADVGRWQPATAPPRPRRWPLALGAQAGSRLRLPLSTSSPWPAPDSTTRSPSTTPAVQAAPSHRHARLGTRPPLVRATAHECGARPELTVTVTPVVAVKSPRLTNAQPETRRADRLASKATATRCQTQLPSMDVHRRTSAPGHPYTE